MAQQYSNIRVPVALHQRLVRVSNEILLAKELGRGYDAVPFMEQGETVRVSLPAVIARALDEFESHRQRSNRRCRSKTTKTQ